MYVRQEKGDLQFNSGEGCAGRRQKYGSGGDTYGGGPAGGGPCRRWERGGTCQSAEACGRVRHEKGQAFPDKNVDACGSAELSAKKCQGLEGMSVFEPEKRFRGSSAFNRIRTSQPRKPLTSPPPVSTSPQTAPSCCSSVPPRSDVC